MDEYILFADEMLKSTNNPYFCLAGHIIKRCDYENILIPEVNRLKIKHFESTNVIFHYTDMKNNKNGFKKLEDPVSRNKFYTDFVCLISKLNISIIGVYYEDKLMKLAFKKGKFSNYDIAFRYLLENYLHYLNNVDGVGAICIESRTFNENMMLELNYLDYINSGSVFFNSEIAKKHLASIGFSIKADNCIGLQIADFIPARLMRNVSGKKDNYKFDLTLISKIYKSGTNLQSSVGLKKIF
jgi:hypothetical protein